MLRRFKKLCEKEGLTKDIKRRQYFEKPSERRRRAQRKAVQRLARIQYLKGQRTSPSRGTPSPQGPSRGPRGGRR
jgi:small subunit ribosomal protein S21